MSSLRDKLGQLPLFTPDSDWSTPKTLPQIPSDIPVAVDTETRDDGIQTGLGPGWPFGLCRVVGVSLAWREDRNMKSLYLPLRHPDSENIPADTVNKYVQNVLSNASRVVMFNGAYDLPVLELEGIKTNVDTLEDAYVAAALLSQSHFSYTLESCCEREGIAGKDTQLLSEALVAFTGKPSSKGELWRLPARYVGPYGERDAEATLELWEILRPRISENDLDGSYRTEIKLIEVTTRMRQKGISINIDKAQQARDELKKQTKSKLLELSSQVGSSLSMSDLSSAKRLARLFDKLGVTYSFTRTGLPSFESKWLSEHPHPFAQLVAETRSCNDLGEKFISNYLLGFTHHGSIHPEWNCLRDSDKGTKTGRLSSSNPPMQQIPSRQEVAAGIIRSLFEARYGGIILSADYKSQEPRLAIHFAEKMNATRAHEVGDQYRAYPNSDLHQICADILGISRSSAKIILLGIMYGMSPKTMSFRLGVSPEEGLELYNRVLDVMPWLKSLSDEVTAVAKERGSIRLLDGARLWFDTWEPSYWSDAEGQMPIGEAEAKIKWAGKKIRRAMVRKALNYLIQGSAARQTKVAMVLCHEAGYTPLASVHDELVFEIGYQKDSLEIQRIMKEATPLTIPVGVDAEHGRNWAIAGKYKYKTVDEARLSPH